MVCVSTGSSRVGTCRRVVKANMAKQQKCQSHMSWINQRNMRNNIINIMYIMAGIGRGEKIQCHDIHRQTSQERKRGFVTPGSVSIASPITGLI